MSDIEDQQMEMEALESIYPNELKVKSSTAPISFSLRLSPNLSGPEESNHVAINIQIEFPNDYPSTSPLTIHVQPEKGLTNEFVKTLQELAESTAQASVGSVSTFVVCEALIEWLRDHNTPSLSMHEQMEERNNISNTKSESSKFIEDDESSGINLSTLKKKKFQPSPLGIEPGTIVTKDSFASWKTLFDAEQARIQEEKLANDPILQAKLKEKRMTGRQLFQANLAKEIDEDEQDKLAEQEAKDGKLFWFNENIYDDDVPDVDEDEDEPEDGEEEEEDDKNNNDNNNEEEEEEDDGSFQAGEDYQSDKSNKSNVTTIESTPTPTPIPAATVAAPVPLATASSSAPAQKTASSTSNANKATATSKPKQEDKKKGKK